MSLTVEPTAAEFPPAGGVVNLVLTNNSAEVVAFKVKSSNNALFSVSPVFGFVNPSDSTSVQITCKGAIVKSEKKVIQFANANGATAPTSVFQGNSNVSSLTVQCIPQQLAPAPEPAATFEQDQNNGVPEGFAPEQAAPQDENCEQ